MQTRRVRIAGDIIAEVMPSARGAKRAVVLLPGLPSTPCKGRVMKFWARKNWWAVFPRYRGSWESAGQFLRRSPEEDVRDVVAAIGTEMRDAWTGASFTIDAQRIALVGSSFGGTAAVLASRDPRVERAVAFSPVIEWRAGSKAEPLPLLARLTRLGFGEAYRFHMRDWNKLARGSFFDPAAHADEIDGSKILLFHARDDEVVPYRPAERFAGKTGATLKLYKRGGHYGLSSATDARFVKHMTRFLK